MKRDNFFELYSLFDNEHDEWWREGGGLSYSEREDYYKQHKTPEKCKHKPYLHMNAYKCEYCEVPVDHEGNEIE